jgi:hypothetical protein
VVNEKREQEHSQDTEALQIHKLPSELILDRDDSTGVALGAVVLDGPSPTKGTFILISDHGQLLHHSIEATFMEVHGFRLVYLEPPALKTQIQANIHLVFHKSCETILIMWVRTLVLTFLIGARSQDFIFCVGAQSPRRILLTQVASVQWKEWN